MLYTKKVEKQSRLVVLVKREWHSAMNLFLLCKGTATINFDYISIIISLNHLFSPTRCKSIDKHIKKKSNTPHKAHIRVASVCLINSY
jgi:hypothetical protein